jgi:hypothetical protein
MDKGHRLANGKGRSDWLLPLIVGIFLGALLHNYISGDPYPPTTLPKQAVPQFNLMAEAWNAIDQHYVDRSAVQPLLIHHIEQTSRLRPKDHLHISGR